MSTIRTSRVPTRRLLAAGLGVAALALTGCGSAAPGVAATVGDETISVSEVDTAAQSLCAAFEAGILGQGEGAVPFSDIRSGTLQLLAAGAQARQIAEEAGIEPGPEYPRELANLERTARVAGLSEDHVEGYVDTLGSNALAMSVVDQAGEAALIREGADDPSVEEATQAGQAIFTDWLETNGIDFDPRFGLRVEGPSLAVSDTNLSVAVSDTAQAGAAEQTDPSYAASLPSHLRCG